MKAVLSAVAIVVVAILALKIFAVVTGLLLAFIPAILALGAGYTVGRIHGANKHKALTTGSKPTSLSAMLDEHI